MGTKKSKIDTLIFENVYDDGNSIWFTEFDYNGLFKLKKGNVEAELIGIFPNEKFMQERLYIATALCGKELYFAPHSANEIAVYDIEKKILKKIKVMSPNINNNFPWERAKFFKIAVIDENVYFIPFHYPGILCYNTKTQELFCFDDWIEEIEGKRESIWGYFIACVQVKKQLILPCACADAVVVFDTITKKTKILEMPHTSYPCKYSGVSYIDDNFYFIAGDGTLVKGKLKEGQEKVNKIKQLMSSSDDISYYPIQYMNGFIYLFPFKDCMGLKIDIKTDEVMSEKLFDDEIVYNGQNFWFLTVISDREKMYSVTRKSRCFIQYDFSNRRKFEKHVISSEKVGRLIQSKREEDFIEKCYKEYFVERADSLFLMIDALTGTNIKEESKLMRMNKYGNKIYNKLASNIISRKDVD